MLELNMLATLAGGCFWCTEAIFKQLKGVNSTTPGYSDNAESVQIGYDPKIISFETLLEVFFKLHDPTTLNKQGADIGTQYRSAIFFHSPAQRSTALVVIEKSQADYKNKIVTEITEFKKFSPADPTHKDYYFKHRNSPYCKLVIDPKIEKLKKNFSMYLS